MQGVQWGMITKNSPAESLQRLSDVQNTRNLQPKTHAYLFVANLLSPLSVAKAYAARHAPHRLRRC